jgi:Tol biopolymer transport system component/DNA-binding winged helix-turn-helix (wHTH) protein
VEPFVATPSSFPACARFDQFQVDLSSGVLQQSGTRVPVQGQPFQVLRLLLEAEGKVVTREELRQALWPKDTFVDFELGVNTAVKKLRQALEDSAEHPKFIETLPRYGYRFMIPVEWVTGNSDKISPPNAEPIASSEPASLVTRLPPATRGWKLTAALGFVSVILLACAVFLYDQNSYLSRTQLGTLARRVVRGNRDVPRPPTTERRLTANPDDVPVTSAVISPDGKYLAYTDKTGFYLRLVEGGATHALSLPKGFEPLAESWFPDSVHLVVSWFDDSRKTSSLWEVSILGGTPRKLAEEAVHPRVSPDGSKIAFLGGKDSNEELWLMQANGDSPKRIGSGSEASFGPVAWAPDGRWLAYVRTKYNYGTLADDTQLEILDLATGHAEVVLSLAGLADGIDWTNDGRLIYSLAEPPPNQDNFDVLWVRLDRRTARPLGSGSRISGGRGFPAAISVNKDGKRMAVVRRATQLDIYLTEVEAHGKRLSTPRRLTLDQRMDFPFSWTPDSKAVLFMSDRDGVFHLFKQEVDQTQPELLVGGNEDLYMPRLTPDGSTILYVVTSKRGDPSMNVRLMRVPLAGGPAQLVLEGPGIFNYECARLPSTLCVYSQIEREQERFFTFDPMKGKGVELLSAKVKKETGNYNWGLSPDGRYLVTSRRLGPEQEPNLRILSLADGTTRYITVPGSAVRGMDWAADSKSVWVGIGNELGPDTSALLNVDLSGRITRLLQHQRFGAGIPSPDGNRLALFGGTETTNVSLLENF